jgi:hypothetical protein
MAWKQSRGVICALLLLPLFAWSACTGRGQELQARDAKHVSQEEIQAQGMNLDLYSFVQRVRPIWLRKSGPHSITGGDDIRVYVDGMGYAAPTALRFYNVSDVETMTFLDPGRATVRYGVGHTHGAIVVRTHGGGALTH